MYSFYLLQSGNYDYFSHKRFVIFFQCALLLFYEDNFVLTQMYI